MSLPERPTPLTQGDFNTSYGGSLVTSQVMLVIYGISILQTWFYFVNYQKDLLWIKAWVGLVFLLVTLHTIFVTYNIWHYFVESYSNPLSLPDGFWALYGATLLSGVIVFFVESFFAHMVYQVCKKQVWRYVLAGVLAVLILTQLGLSLGLIVRLIEIWELPKISVLVNPFMIPMFVTRVVIDGVIAGALCISLYDSRTAFAKTMKLVRMLITYAMERFVLTALLVFFQTIYLIVHPTNFGAMNIEFFIGHLYFNSLLATLNSRNHVRSQTTRTGNGTSMDYMSSNGASTLAASRFDTTNPSLNTRSGNGPEKIRLGVVNIHSETYTVPDADQKV